jgi:hypothetical protein
MPNPWVSAPFRFVGPTDPFRGQRCPTPAWSAGLRLRRSTCVLQQQAGLLTVAGQVLQRGFGQGAAGSL